MSHRMSRTKRRKAIRIAIFIISVLCLAAVIPLTVFISKGLKNDVQKTIPKGTYSFTFEPEVLVYDGNGSFDPLKGVTVTGEDGNEFSGKITATVREKTGSDTFLLYYSVREKGGVTSSAERTLKVENYSGTSVTYSGRYESFHFSELDNVASVLIGKGLLKADDGFGHDITASVTMDTDAPITGDGEYPVVFKATNFLGEEATALGSIGITIDPDKPAIALTKKSVRINAGSPFNAFDYVSLAFDPVDGDMKNLVSVSCPGFNINIPGNYILKYSFINSRGERSKEVSLDVTVYASNTNPAEGRLP